MSSPGERGLETLARIEADDGSLPSRPVLPIDRNTGPDMICEYFSHARSAAAAARK